MEFAKHTYPNYENPAFALDDPQVTPPLSLRIPGAQIMYWHDLAVWPFRKMTSHLPRNLILFLVRVALDVRGSVNKHTPPHLSVLHYKAGLRTSHI